MPIETNAAELTARLAEIAALAVAGAAAGSVAAAEAVQQVVQHKLTERSHAKHTKTPSAPGQPPARITGDLTSGWVVHPGVGPRGLGAALVNEVVYAQIQERGGDAGRGHASHLPARPSIRPAVDESHAVVEAAYISRWLL